MIRFQCPACNKVLKVADEGAGRKGPCPSCGQRLLIPTPPTQAARKKTVLGTLLAPFSKPAMMVHTPANAASSLADDHGVEVRQASGRVPVSCPGCGRIILLPPHELSLTIECARCDRRFVPSNA